MNRVNEVSNRHQGQLFQILIAPDINQSPMSGDIGCVLSTPIEVKSKVITHICNCNCNIIYIYI